jgi:hypothetical protein
MAFFSAEGVTQASLTRRLFTDDLAAPFQLIEFGYHFCGDFLAIQFVGARLTKELQTMTFSVTDEFVKIKRLVDPTQIIMIESFISGVSRRFKGIGILWTRMLKLSQCLIRSHFCIIADDGKVSKFPIRINSD